jgi:hypothetical protein
LYSTDYFAFEAGGLVVAYIPVPEEVSFGARAQCER